MQHAEVQLDGCTVDAVTFTDSGGILCLATPIPEVGEPAASQGQCLQYFDLDRWGDEAGPYPLPKPYPLSCPAPSGPDLEGILCPPPFPEATTHQVTNAAAGLAVVGGAGQRGP